MKVVVTVKAEWGKQVSASECEREEISEDEYTLEADGHGSYIFCIKIIMTRETCEHKS